MNSTTVTGQQSNDDDGIVSLAKSSFFSILLVMKKREKGVDGRSILTTSPSAVPALQHFFCVCVAYIPFCVIGKIEWWNISRSSPLLLLSSIKTHRQPDIQIKRRSQIDNGLYSAWRGQIALTPVQQQQQQHARPFPLSLYAYIAWTVYILQLRQLSTIFSGIQKVVCLFVWFLSCVFNNTKKKEKRRAPS